jgi:hypothetical protein
MCLLSTYELTTHNLVQSNLHALFIVDKEKDVRFISSGRCDITQRVIFVGQRV